jgi:general secretion pathway protein A
MRQLAQRVTARYHLEPIAQQDVSGYIQHRLQICGTSHVVFSKRAVDLIRRLSGGIPRLINVLCDRSLLGAYVEGKSRVDRRIVKKAAREVLAEDAELSDRRRWVVPVLGGLAGALLVAAVLYYHPWQGMDIGAALFNVSEILSPVAAVPPASERDSATAPGDMAVPAAVKVMPEVEENPMHRTTGLQEGISLGTLLAAADNTYYRTAWTELLALWSIVLPKETKPDFCNFVYSNGMRCSFGTGTWADLSFYDRPVILKLDKPNGQSAPVVLRYLDDTVAELLIGGETFNVPMEQIDQYWHGDYILLLQAPPHGLMTMMAGTAGPDVGWLREQVERIQGVDLRVPDPFYFDDGLRQHVMDFQRNNGLAVDGIVGKNTIIRLNSLSGNPRIPSLVRKRS